ncbi:MAG TPA: prephenate dehydrogenase/arogenate dehydrogenase family protein, partial [Marinobacter sp.]|nr:prephenate dehydrogenase/arogenate dehydrogenase family protein [Marinobacter sp.]
MPIAQPLFQRVAVIGLGLIGGSLAAALREKKLAKEVVGFDTRADELAMGVELGVINSAADSAAQAVSGADLVVLAVPVRATQAVLREIQSALNSDAIITDVGSTKSGFVNDVRAVFGHLPATVISGHPIAGSEKSGIRAA